MALVDVTAGRDYFLEEIESAVTLAETLEMLEDMYFDNPRVKDLMLLNLFLAEVTEGYPEAELMSRWYLDEQANLLFNLYDGTDNPRRWLRISVPEEEGEFRLIDRFGRSENVFEFYTQRVPRIFVDEGSSAFYRFQGVLNLYNKLQYSASVAASQLAKSTVSLIGPRGGHMQMPTWQARHF